jgi:hypothetical protein
LQLPLQHSLPAVQGEVEPLGRHIVVVEVVLVDVEVVGVVVDVLVEVEVVLVDVLVDVLVVGAAVVVVVGLSPHGPRVSPWAWWLSSARWETSMVFWSGVPGLWQMVTLFG